MSRMTPTSRSPRPLPPPIACSSSPTRASTSLHSEFTSWRRAGPQPRWSANVSTTGCSSIKQLARDVLRRAASSCLPLSFLSSLALITSRRRAISCQLTTIRLSGKEKQVALGREGSGNAGLARSTENPSSCFFSQAARWPRISPLQAPPPTRLGSLQCWRNAEASYEETQSWNNFSDCMKRSHLETAQSQQAADKVAKNGFSRSLQGLFCSYWCVGQSPYGGPLCVHCWLCGLNTSATKHFIEHSPSKAALSRMCARPEHPLVPDQCLLHRSCCQRFPALLPVGGAEGLDETCAHLQ